LSFAVRAGVDEERVLLDPGIGFGKTVAHNLELLARLGELAELGRPLVVGTSRKSFLGRLAADAAGEAEPVAPALRLPGTIATNVLALERGASVFRVHDVAPVRDALAVAAATLGERWTVRGTTRTS
jgi:dihydropteroate synthase